MDQTKFADINKQIDRMQKSYKTRIKKYSEETGMPEHWVRPIVKAQLSIERVQAQVARRMGVNPKEASAQAEKIAGNRKKDAENLGKYGASKWAFARCYLTLSEIDEIANDMDGSPYPAIAALAHVAETLIFAMEVMTKEQRAQNGSKGGQKSAKVTAEVRDEAIRLANEMVPDGGWASAPKAAAAILPHLSTFARGKGRSPSVRKVEEWLRGAGIKRTRTQQ